MHKFLLLIGIVLILCIFTQKITSKLPVPSLLFFLFLGILFGVEGIFKISYDNYGATDVICSICLLFIMFYGGFGTSFKAAKPVLLKSVLLSTLGVVFTAFFTGCFTHYVLHLPWLESFLIGSVIASTDAASVFNILRGKNLNLKNNTASLLEVESGSNDPISYMLTIVLCALMKSESFSLFPTLFNQIFFGICIGLLMGKITSKFLIRGSIPKEEKTIFVLAMVIICYALSSLLKGNGYLSVYLCGILMGNANIPKKSYMVHFFDTLTGMAQMMIFFLLGLLVTPSQLKEVLIPAILIMLFLTFIGRPLSVTSILLPFKTNLSQIGIVSWAGLRGVASIVFSISVVLSNVTLHYNLYNLVFCIVLLSISIQGTLLPYMAYKLNMIDENEDVHKTFNDYRKENDIQFIKVLIEKGHSWENKTLSQIDLSSSLLVVLIIREGKKNVIPNGNTIIKANDLLVLAAQEYKGKEDLTIYEMSIEKKHKYVNKTLESIDLEKGELILMIQRNEQTIIPDGTTRICVNDTLVIIKK